MRERNDENVRSTQIKIKSTIKLILNWDRSRSTLNFLDFFFLKIYNTAYSSTNLEMINHHK